VPEGLPPDWIFRTPVFSLTAKGGCDLRITWLKILQDYTRRVLSMSKDKFPAIGAIADLVQSQTGDKYVAGFFLAQLPRALL